MYDYKLHFPLEIARFNIWNLWTLVCSSVGLSETAISPLWLSKYGRRTSELKGASARPTVSSEWNVCTDSRLNSFPCFLYRTERTTMDCY